MYSGKVHVFEKDIVSLLSAAHKFQVKGLMKIDIVRRGSSIIRSISLLVNYPECQVVFFFCR